MTSQVTVIDYGIGNLLSVCRALEHSGATVHLTSIPTEVEKSERLVLPGVGAFADGMKGLKKQQLDEAIRSFTKTDRPFLGICLGMQMMLEVSEEFGTHEGLGLIPGKVIAIPSTSIEGEPHKIPHIGWNTLIKPSLDTNWENSILTNVLANPSVYFVHSFTAIPTIENHRLADCYYNGRKISAALQLNNMVGCQFHPEKSGIVGLQLMKNFLYRT